MTFRTEHYLVIKMLFCMWIDVILLDEIFCLLERTYRERSPAPWEGGIVTVDAVSWYNYLSPKRD